MKYVACNYPSSLLVTNNKIPLVVWQKQLQYSSVWISVKYSVHILP